MKKKLRIGPVEIKHPVFMSPMASITDIAFRRLLDELGGVGLMVTELISAEAIRRRSRRTLEMLTTFEGRTPQFVQLFGSREDAFREAGKFIQNETAYQGIDINMGCPARKVTRKGGGAALLTDLGKIRDIITALKQAVTLPVTAKIRLGWEEINVFEVIGALNELGLDGITVHFRLKTDNYSTPARWEFAQAIGEKIQSIFIGNGDITKVADITKRLQVCDAVMIGRGAVRDPLIFARYSAGPGEHPDIKMSSIIQRLTVLIEAHYPEQFQLTKLKSYLQYFFSNHRHARIIRRTLFQCKTYPEAKAYLSSSGILDLNL